MGIPREHGTSKWISVLTVLALASSPLARGQGTSSTASPSSSTSVAPGVGVTDTSGAITPIPGTSAGTPTPGTIPAPGEGEGPAPLNTEDTPITIPGAYGSSPVVLTPGAGRFSRPPFRFSVSAAMGYDDNIFTTPLHPIKQPKGFPQVEQEGSAVSQASVRLEMQGANPRTLYTLDADIGVLYYWNRPTDQADYQASISLLFLHRITPRVSISTSTRAGYQSQPDFSRLNSPVSLGSGNYYTLDSKVDISYQWTARISAVLSGAVNATIFEDPAFETGNIITETLGLQGRYLWSPRTTLALEARTEQVLQPEAEDANSTGQFFLFGADYSLSSRLRATVRVGEQIRFYDSSGSETQSSPYGETTLAYTYGRGSTIAWNNRFGLENSRSAANKTVSYRTGVQIRHVLTGRITANAGVNYNFLTTSLAGATNSEDVTQHQTSVNLGIRYVVSRSLSLNANYYFDQILSSIETTDYRRNRFFLGVDYAF